MKNIRKDFSMEVTTELKYGKWAGVIEWREIERTTTQNEQLVQRPWGQRKHHTNKEPKGDQADEFRIQEV